MIIRTATLADLPQIFEIGAKCYPAEEALTQEEYRGRLLVYPHHFWLLEKDQMNIPPQTGQQNGGNRSRVTVEMSPGVPVASPGSRIDEARKA